MRISNRSCRSRNKFEQCRSMRYPESTAAIAGILIESEEDQYRNIALHNEHFPLAAKFVFQSANQLAHN
jgi:hypothetical protein